MDIVKSINEDCGAAVFKFEPSLELVTMRADSYVSYLLSKERREYATPYFPLNCDTLSMKIDELVQLQFPEYKDSCLVRHEMNKNSPIYDFDERSLNAKNNLRGYAIYHNRNEDNIDGGLIVNVHTERGFYPKFKEGGIMIHPKLTALEVGGYVYVSGIPFPDKEGCSYGGDINSPIINALLQNKEIKLNDYTLMRGVGLLNGDFCPLDFVGSVSLVYINNPTGERMKKALEAKKVLKEYNLSNATILQQAAQVIITALDIVEHKNSMIGSFREVKHHFAEEDKWNQSKNYNLNVRGALPDSIGDLLAEFDILINSKLREATSIIRPLYETYPRDLMDYAWVREVKGN